MSKGATRGNEGTSGGAVVHVAFELDDQGWKLAFGTRLGKRPWLRRVRPRDREAILAAIEAAKKHFELPPRCRGEVGGAVGLVPTPYDSGATRREQGISKAGNRTVRWMTVQIAWAWLRHQPDSALSRWYNRRFAQGGRRMKKIGIVALARKLVIELWRYVETGALPEGATLKG